MRRIPIFRLLAAITMAMPLAACASAPAPEQGPKCGTWTATVADQDPRLTVEQASPPDAGSCLTVFRVTSNTKALGILGGYTLEMTTDSPTNMQTRQWAGLPGNNADQIVPGRPGEFRAAPQDPRTKAQVTAAGTINADSLATDTSLFLIKSALALLSLPAGCLIPPDVILVAATSENGVVRTVADRLFARDVAGAVNALRNVNDDFFGQAVSTLKAQAPQCAVPVLSGLLGLVTGLRGTVFVAKTVVNFGSWAGAVVEDRVRYQGKPVRVVFDYAPPPAKS